MTEPRRYGGKSHPATPTQEQTRPISTETSNLVEKSTLWYFLQTSWWPNRADMVKNFIPRRQLRSKRDQYRRKLAIYTKNMLFLISAAQTGIVEIKRCKLMTKPRRYGGKSHPATPTQEQTRPISTETSNLYKNYAVFDVSCKNEPWKKKRCKLMTKPRRYGGKSHPATPTQEQTRPISTETSNLVEKSTLWYFLQRRALKKQKLQVDDQTAQIWWKISSRDANSGANEPNIDGN